MAELYIYHKNTDPMMEQNDSTYDEIARWYALYTRPRFEKKVASSLLEKGIENYLPLQKVRRRWSDRWKTIEVPLFSNYVFVHFLMKERVNALCTHGVIRLVSTGCRPSSIPDKEISAIKRVLGQVDEVETLPVPFFRVGDKVTVIRGPMSGIEGQLIEWRGKRKLIISIEAIKQTFCVEIDPHNVCALQPAPLQHS